MNNIVKITAKGIAQIKAEPIKDSGAQPEGSL